LFKARTLSLSLFSSLLSYHHLHPVDIAILLLFRVDILRDFLCCPCWLSSEKEQSELLLLLVVPQVDDVGLSKAPRFLLEELSRELPPKAPLVCGCCCCCCSPPWLLLLLLPLLLPPLERMERLALALASVGMRREEMRLDVGRAIWAVVVLALKFKFEFAPKFALAAVLQGPGVPPALVLVASPSPVFAS
jgi:hypothetical protein